MKTEGLPEVLRVPLMSQACTTGGIFIFESREKKYHEQLSLACFSECFGFEAIFFLLLVSLRMFEGIGGGGGEVLSGWVTGWRRVSMWEKRLDEKSV